MLLLLFDQNKRRRCNVFDVLRPIESRRDFEETTRSLEETEALEEYPISIMFSVFTWEAWSRAFLYYVFWSKWVTWNHVHCKIRDA